MELDDEELEATRKLNKNKYIDINQLKRAFDLVIEDIVNYKVPYDFCKQYGKRKRTCKELENDEACKQCVKEWYLKKFSAGILNFLS